jgi:hypothetical protein
MMAHRSTCKCHKIAASRRVYTTTAFVSHWLVLDNLVEKRHFITVPEKQELAAVSGTRACLSQWHAAYCTR